MEANSNETFEDCQKVHDINGSEAQCIFVKSKMALRFIKIMSQFHEFLQSFSFCNTDPDLIQIVPHCKM